MYRNGTIADMEKTLKQLRDESGLTLREVVDRMQAFDSTTPKTHVGLLHLEQRGTDRLSILRALASAYEVPLETVVAAASRSREDSCAV